jgi:hypothetical protein
MKSNISLFEYEQNFKIQDVSISEEKGNSG